MVGSQFEFDGDIELGVLGVDALGGDTQVEVFGEVGGDSGFVEWGCVILGHNALLMGLCDRGAWCAFFLLAALMDFADKALTFGGFFVDHAVNFLSDMVDELLDGGELGDCSFLAIPLTVDIGSGLEEFEEFFDNWGAAIFADASCACIEGDDHSGGGIPIFAEVIHAEFHEVDHFFGEGTDFISIHEVFLDGDGWLGGGGHGSFVHVTSEPVVGMSGFVDSGTVEGGDIRHTAEGEGDDIEVDFSDFIFAVVEAEPGGEFFILGDNDAAVDFAEGSFLFIGGDGGFDNGADDIVIDADEGAVVDASEGLAEGVLVDVGVAEFIGDILTDIGVDIIGLGGDILVPGFSDFGGGFNSAVVIDAEFDEFVPCFVEVHGGI